MIGKTTKVLYKGPDGSIWTRYVDGVVLVLPLGTLMTRVSEDSHPRDRNSGWATTPYVTEDGIVWYLYSDEIVTLSPLELLAAEGRQCTE